MPSTLQSCWKSTTLVSHVGSLQLWCDVFCHHSGHSQVVQPKHAALLLTFATGLQ